MQHFAIKYITWKLLQCLHFTKSTQLLPYMKDVKCYLIALLKYRTYTVCKRLLLPCLLGSCSVCSLLSMLLSHSNFQMSDIALFLGLSDITVVLAFPQSSPPLQVLRLSIVSMHLLRMYCTVVQISPAGNTPAILFL